MSQPDSRHDSRVFEGIDAVIRLHDLDLTPEILHNVEFDARSASLKTTSLHPPTAAGTYAWAEATHALRQQLVQAPERWVSEDKNGQPLIRHPKGTHELVVSNGNEGTGIATRTPRTRCAKGLVTRRAVQRNQKALWQPEPDIRTYVFLIHIDNQGQIRSELSLPVDFDHEDRIAVWEERIIVPRPKRGPLIAPATAPSLDDGDYRPGVLIERKTA